MSRAFTIKHRTYQVCIECGREFDYSWALMHSVQPRVANSVYATMNTVGRPESSAI
jgi:hypothetical protein